MAENVILYLYAVFYKLCLIFSSCRLFIISPAKLALTIPGWCTWRPQQPLVKPRANLPYQRCLSAQMLRQHSTHSPGNFYKLHQTQEFGPLIPAPHTLHSNIQTNITIHGFNIPSHILYCGTRKGRPILFNLSFHPLIRLIQTDTSLHRISLGIYIAL